MPVLFLVPFNLAPGYALNILSDVSPLTHFSNNINSGFTGGLGSPVFLSITGSPVFAFVNPSNVTI